MLSRLYQVLVLFMLIVVLSACNSVQKSINTPSCKLPCWNGITPGETSVDESIQYLQLSNYINNKSIRRVTLPNSFPQDEVIFSFTDRGRGNLGVEHDSVTIIHLGEIRIRMGEIITKLGDPLTYIILPYWQPEWFVTYLYPNQGTIIQTIKRSSKDNNSISIKKSDVISEMYIVDPEKFQDLLNYVAYLSTQDDNWNPYSIVQKWDGFGIIKILRP